MYRYELCPLQVEDLKSQMSSVVIEAHVKVKPLSPCVPECLISAAPSYRPKILVLCYITEILKFFVGVEKPALS